MSICTNWDAAGTLVGVKEASARLSLQITEYAYAYVNALSEHPTAYPTTSGRRCRRLRVAVHVGHDTPSPTGAMPWDRECQLPLRLRHHAGERRSGAMDQQGSQMRIPRLEMPSMRTRPPVPLWRGTRPSQAANSRPDGKAAGSPIIATRAVAPSNPTPGIAETGGWPGCSGATSRAAARLRRPRRRVRPRGPTARAGSRPPSPAAVPRAAREPRACVAASRPGRADPESQHVGDNQQRRVLQRQRVEA